MKNKKRWYDYLWILELVYFSLGFFNILFAWLGLCMFLIPLFLALAGWDKAYCNRYCDRGQLFALLGQPIPQDIPGTNPQAMAREEILRPVAVTIP